MIFKKKLFFVFMALSLFPSDSFAKTRHMQAVADQENHKQVPCQAKSQMCRKKGRRKYPPTSRTTIGVATGAGAACGGFVGSIVGVFMVFMRFS